MRLSEMAVDVKLQEEGEWFDHPIFEGVRVCVRSVHSEAYKRRNRQLLNRLPPRSVRKRGDSVEAFEEIQLRLLAEAALVGWTGVDGEDEEPLEFSPEKAAEILKKPEYRKFAAGIAECANQAGDRDEAWLEEDAGNLPEESVES